MRPSLSERHWPPKLAEEEFQEPMHAGENGGPRQENGDARSRPETCAEGQTSRPRQRFCCRRPEGQQTLDTQREIVVTSAERSVEKRRTRSRPHSRHTQERRGERERPLRISAHGCIVGSPLRELCPTPLEGSATAEEGNGSRRKKEKEPLEIVTREAMSIFVLPGQVELLGGKRTNHTLRREQAWTEDTDERQERSALLDQHYHPP